MNQTLDNIIVGGLLATTFAGFYLSLDKASKMTQVNPTNPVVLYFKTPTNQHDSTETNLNYSNKQ